MKNQEQIKVPVSTHIFNEKSNQQEVQSYSDQDNKTVNKIKPNLKKKNKQNPIICNIAETKYPVVKYVCKKVLNFKLQKMPNQTGWDIMWTDNAVQPEQLSRMQPYQKINHFPGMYSLSRKNFLGKNLMRMRKRFPDQYNFFPMTWMLPSQYGEFKSYYQKNKKSKTYIVKPEASCQGRGIFLTKDIQDIQQGQHYVVQKYILRPFLLENLKFDFRIYVLLAGCSPLRIYLYNQGLTRFATQKYVQPNKNNMDKPCMHLTNYAINKTNQNFVYNESVNQMNTGHKRSLTAVLNLLQKTGYDVKQLWSNIKDILIKTFISAQPVLAHQYKSCQPDNYANNMCFQLLGFDIMLDQKFKPNLLEVNYTPSFSTDTPLDKLIKRNVIGDSLKLMNITNKFKNQIINLSKEAVLKRVLSGKKQRLTNEEKLEQIRKAQQKRDEWENKHLGGFQKIYPIQNSKQYDQYLEYSNNCYQQLTGANIRRNMKKEKSINNDIKKQTFNDQNQKVYKQRISVPKPNIQRRPNLSLVKNPIQQNITIQTKSKIQNSQRILQKLKLKNELNFSMKIQKYSSAEKQSYNNMKILMKESDLGNYVRPKLFQLNNFLKNTKE